MFAYLNNKTFTIQSLADGAPVVLAGGVTTADELRGAGVTESSPSIPGERMPVVIDAAGGPIYGYIVDFYMNGSDCEVWVWVAEDSPNGFPITAETNVPCRVQLHANALKQLESGVSTRMVVASAPALASVRAGRTYVSEAAALTTVTLTSLPDGPGIFWIYAYNNIYLEFDLDSVLGVNPASRIRFYGSASGLDTSGPLPKIYGAGFHQCIWDGVDLHVIKFAPTDTYTPGGAVPG